MDLAQLAKSIEGFGGWTHAENIRFFAWHLHEHEGRATVSTQDIAGCYRALSMAPPSNIGPFLKVMSEKKKPELVKTSNGFYLERSVRESFNSKYGQRAATVQVHKLLADLPSKIPSVAERGYLEEALICFRHRAFRAAIVMTWNMAFDHLCHFVLTKHLAAFNAQLPKSYPKANVSGIAKRDDFSELKEYEVLQVCKSANIISKSIHKILQEKLDRRNICAHPSGAVATEPTAEEFITDLVTNAVVTLT